MTKMKMLCDQLRKTVESIQRNPNLDVSGDGLKPPKYSASDVSELEDALGIQYSKDLRAFYGEIGELSIRWQPKPHASIAEDDIGYVVGQIGLLDPFYMAMGNLGKRWKDEIWFEALTPAGSKLRTFMPFDWPTPQLVAGFQLVEKTIGDTIHMWTSGEPDTEPTKFTLPEYLEWLIATRGLVYWQNILTDPNGDSDERKRCKTYLPAIFPDFDGARFAR